MRKKNSSNKFLNAFGLTVMVLALVRCAYTGVTGSVHAGTGHSTAAEAETPANAETTDYRQFTPTCYPADNQPPHRILGVSSYEKAFPDSNHVQLAAAQQWGVPPIKDRAEAEERKDRLVFMDCSPYYDLAQLDASIPYLVPRAALLLQDIGQAFMDSLLAKGIPLHKIIVSSVLRSQSDVAKLKRTNGNATEKSCHLYGTTFDIKYNKYSTVESPYGPARRPVRNDTLKYVLSEVLNDMRKQNRCYVKYERKQSCFHMTVR